VVQVLRILAINRYYMKQVVQVLRIVTINRCSYYMKVRGSTGPTYSTPGPNMPFIFGSTITEMIKITVMILTITEMILRLPHDHTMMILNTNRDDHTMIKDSDIERLWW
jgi:hypothetical protein